MSGLTQRIPDPLVLVVDDEPLVCRVTVRILADAGFRVLEAHDGEEALGLLATVGVLALVVSDLTMPGMTGLELEARVRELWPTVPVLLVSGKDRPPIGHPGHFLPKPFSPNALLAAVQRLLL